MGFITIKNDGKEIIETDYFDSELNQAGKFFLSLINPFLLIFTYF